MIDDDRELQHEVTHAALQAVEQHGFALAGSGAIREHGIVDRPTRDVDLFTNDMDPAVFETAVDHLTIVLTEAGYTVEEVRRSKQFAHLNVATSGGRAVDIDLAIDWREQEAVRLDVGPVLSVEDACATKVNALYTRMEARDFIDVDAIRDSGRFTDSELLRLVAERDAGFDREIFAGQLQQIERIPDGRFTEYGLDNAQVQRLRDKTTSWADRLRNLPPADRNEDGRERTRERQDRRREAGLPAQDHMPPTAARRSSDSAQPASAERSLDD